MTATSPTAGSFLDDVSATEVETPLAPPPPPMPDPADPRHAGDPAAYKQDRQAAERHAALLRG